MMVKSGLEKIFLKFLHGKPLSSNSFYLLVLRKITNSVTKITIFQHERKFEMVFFPYLLDLIHLFEQNIFPDFNLRVKLDK